MTKRGQDSPLCCFSSLGLPSYQGVNGHRAPDSMPQPHSRRGTVHVYKHHVTYRRIAVQPSPAEHLPTRVCAAQMPRVGEAPEYCMHYWSSHPTWLQQSISLQGKRRKATLSHICSSPETPKCGEKERLSFTRKERLQKRQPYPGLGLWGLIIRSWTWLK